MNIVAPTLVIIKTHDVPSTILFRSLYPCIQFQTREHLQHGDDKMLFYYIGSKDESPA